jgi:hypothetical protein
MFEFQRHVWRKDATDPDRCFQCIHPREHRIHIEVRMTESKLRPPAGRYITTHHDGHGTQEKITIISDEPDPRDGAAHNYSLNVERVTAWTHNGDFATLRFQRGPKNDPDHVPGLTDAALLAVLIDRYEGFQRGPFACRENAIVLTHLQTAALWIRARADDRARRGVMGTRAK